MNKPELNIFIEDTIESGLDVRKITEKLQKMTHYFLSKEIYVKNSCLHAYEYDSICFDIVLCNNYEIHRINKEYRNIDHPTDVISFAIFADSAPNERFIFDNEINLGEIILSIEKTKAQAIENGQTFEDELYFLLAHGILHLMGFDHLTEETLNEMWKIQKEMTGEINV